MPKGAGLCNLLARGVLSRIVARWQSINRVMARCGATIGPGHADPMAAPASPKKPLGTDYLLAALADEGLRHLFMVPGGLVDPFLPALARQTRLTPIVAAHEGGAVYMADGYARASGGFGAALGIGGPGAGNMATAVAAAKTDGSPLLVMTGEAPVDMEGRGEFQDASQATLDDTAVMSPLTRDRKSVVY